MNQPPLRVAEFRECEQAFYLKGPGSARMGSALSAPTMATMYTKLLPCQIYCPPSPASYSHTRDIVMLSTIDGKRIACRLFAPFKDNVDTFVDYKNRHSTILFSHGNADDIGTSASYCQWIADSVSCNVVAYDYVNYGLSDRHETTEHNMHHSIEAVYGYLRGSLDIPASRIFLFGKSLGSIPTVHLASQPYVEEIAGTILVSPIASGARVLLPSTRLPASMMCVLDDMFAPNIKRMGLVKCPVLIVHGTEDKVVPVQNAHDLFERLKDGCDYPPLWVDAGHNDIESRFKNLFISSVNAFLRHCVATAEAIDPHQV